MNETKGQHPRMVSLPTDPSKMLHALCPRARTWVTDTGKRVIELDGKRYEGDTLNDAMYCAGIKERLDDYRIP